MSRRIRLATTLACCLAALVSLFVQPAAAGWVSAPMSAVSHELTVDGAGRGRLTTTAGFAVRAGTFHGFRLAELAGAELDPAASFAVADDGRRFDIETKPQPGGGRVVRLAGRNSVKAGGVTFTLVHDLGLVASGQLRLHEGRARLALTPFVWDDGLDAVTFTLKLPGPSRDAPPVADPLVSEDYEIAVQETGLTLTKQRAPRWYPLLVVVDFDPRLVPGLVAEPGASAASAPIATGRTAPAALAVAPPAPATPFGPWPFGVVALAALVGVLLSMAKSIRIERLARTVGVTTSFLVLPRIQTPARVALSLFALGAGLAGQLGGSVAAGMPALGLAAALWLSRREPHPVRPRPGGEWRPLGDNETRRWHQLARAHEASRRGLLDATTLRGATLFLLIATGVGAGAWRLAAISPDAALALALDSMVFVVPLFFSAVHAELPADAALLGFAELRRWQKRLARLARRLDTPAHPVFHVREDVLGPIETRLRLEPAPPGLIGIEVAAELVAAGTTLRVRPAVVIRLAPGTQAARQIAALPQAAEHHLTPDLDVELIVLRDRRGYRSSGLTALGTALATLRA